MWRDGWDVGGRGGRKERSGAAVASAGVPREYQSKMVNDHTA